MSQLAEIIAQSLADDLVHDLRNGLTGVLGAIQIVRDSLHEGEERQTLDAVIARIHRMSGRLHDTALADS